MFFNSNLANSRPSLHHLHPHAAFTIPVLFLTPSFCIRLNLWFSTVLGLKNSFSAISWLVSPEATALAKSTTEVENVKW
jgi:hypothetical protein